MIHYLNNVKHTAMFGALAMGLMCNAALAQDELWVLSEGRFDWTTGEVAEAPSLGHIDMATLNYQELLEFDGAAFATDLEIAGGRRRCGVGESCGEGGPHYRPNPRQRRPSRRARSRGSPTAQWS